MTIFNKYDVFHLHLFFKNQTIANLFFINRLPDDFKTY